MRNFDRESWRPLFLREPAEQRGRWDVTTRGLRDYLIRLAEDDGALLKHCAEPLDELAAILTTGPHERDAVRGAIETLLRDGFLRWEGSLDTPGWLGVDRLVTFPVHETTDAAMPPEDVGALQETPDARRRRLARERKQRSRGRDGRDRERDPGRDQGGVTSVTPERDQRDLPPQSPPSDKEINKDSEDARARPHRDRQRDTPRDMRGVTRARATAPAEGTGHIQPQLDHRRFAEQHGLDLEDFLVRLRSDPRSKNLSTVQGWEVLTRMLQLAVAKKESWGGAA